MTANIRIDPTACIRCERCVRVCPAQLFARSAGDGAVGVHDPERCIVCGHCVAAVTEEVSAIPGVTDVTVDLAFDAFNSGGACRTCDGKIGRAHV